MFNSDVLDVAIGLVFIYLVLSLVSSALAELIESVQKSRAKDLEEGIRMLLDDTQNGQNNNANDGKIIVNIEKIYQHPLISGLFQGDYKPTEPKSKPGKFFQPVIRILPWYRRNLPSYIPTKIFARVLMDEILPGNQDKANVTDLRIAINNIANKRVKEALLALIDDAGNDISKSRKNIEMWYDNAMDRVSGWYKRRTQFILLVLGFLVAFSINADTIAIVRNLSRNKTLRDSIIASAQEWTKNQPPTPQFTTLETELNNIGSLGLPIGWNSKNTNIVPPFFLKGGKFDGNNILPWLLKLIGWFITAVAITLGGPFWFDVLNKFMTYRSTIKPKEDKPTV